MRPGIGRARRSVPGCSAQPSPLAAPIAARPAKGSGRGWPRRPFEDLKDVAVCPRRRRWFPFDRRPEDPGRSVHRPADQTMDDGGCELEDQRDDAPGGPVGQTLTARHPRRQLTDRRGRGAAAEVLAIAVEDLEHAIAAVVDAQAKLLAV